MTKNDQPKQINTRAQRSFKYGLNVAISVLAAVAIVVLVNWIAHRRFIRFDQTATREYTLSKQTLNVLEGLEGEYQVVTLFARSSPYVDQARDLMTEYGRYADEIQVQHLHPSHDLVRVKELLEVIRGRYSQTLGPIADSIDAGLRAMKELQGSIPSMLEPLRAALEDTSLPEGEFKSFLQSVAQGLGRLDSDIEFDIKQINEGLDGPLPRYRDAKEALSQYFSNLDEDFFAVVRARFEQAVNDSGTGNSTKDSLLKLLGVIKPVHDRMMSAATDLDAAEVAEEYETVANQLATPDTVAVVSPAQVRVLALTEMFREPDPNQVQPGEQPDLRFQGEEKLTGALVSMSLEHPPLVVFVTDGQSSAIGPRGMYQTVADRLRALNFDIQEWSPVGQPGPMGQMGPPKAVPVAKEGQRAVWIVLPVPPVNPMNPLTAGNNQKIADQLQRVIQDGHSAMVLLAASAVPSFAVDPIVETLTPWGITPQLDRIILRQLVMPNGVRRAASQLDILPDSWPDELGVSGTLRGMPGIFLQASPLVLGQGGEDGLEVWPLVRVQDPDTWSERDFQSPEPPELDPATAGKPYVIAAAAGKADTRVVVVADPAWASDQVVSYGALGPGTADLFGARFPANAELFVNSICWLGHLDELIAASARTQDIRRVGPMTRSGLTGLRWSLLLGMPLAVLVVGVGVWLNRRAV